MDLSISSESLDTSAAPVPAKTRTNSDVRNFTISVLVGTFVGGLLFVWVLWDLFSGGLQPMRMDPNDNFYDAQAKAILHGHLWFSKAILGIEGFKHDGHYFTYFGVLPSLLRIPFILADPGLSGRLTGPSMLVAWTLIALFSGMLMWRVRVFVRGTSPLGTGELFSYGALMAVVTGGSVLLLLASAPWVYNEDLIWSIACTVGCLFALLGILERPSKGRVVAAGVLLLAVNLDRLPTAWACDVGAILVVAWLVWRRSGDEARSFGPLLLLVVAVALSLAAGCFVNWMKFGVPFGLPLRDQVWTSMNAHFREFLDQNHGNAYSLKFVPTTFWTYFQPFGIRLETVFPYVTLPATPPEIVGGVFFDQVYRTASVPASMPLMFLLTCWGVVASFLRNVPKKAKLLRIPLVAGAGAFGVSFVWGYIAPRFEADLLPLLILGSAAGMAHLWRKVESRAGQSRAPDEIERDGTNKSRRRIRPSGAMARVVVGLFVIFGLYSMAANFGIAAPPALLTYDSTQAVGYVTTQQAWSNRTGDPLGAYVMQGSQLPYYAPAGKLFVINGCSPTDGGLYVSSGETFKYDPVQNAEHNVWLPVERGAQVVHLFEYTFNGPAGKQSGRVPLVSVGPEKIFVETARDSRHLI
ncbi:MAG: hypothetical protein ACRD6W_11090, partial [Nitrososphaerales archaeon]